MMNNKCVLIVNEQLPPGLIANTAVILGITLGSKLPQIVGIDVCDAGENVHLGITELPIPVLRSDEESLKAMREKLYAPDYADLMVVDFSDLAQGCKTYTEYIEKIRSADGVELRYLGLLVCGSAKKVNKLTGSLALLR